MSKLSNYRKRVIAHRWTITIFLWLILISLLAVISLVLGVKNNIVRIVGGIFLFLIIIAWLYAFFAQLVKRRNILNAPLNYHDTLSANLSRYGVTPKFLFIGSLMAIFLIGSIYLIFYFFIKPSL